MPPPRRTRASARAATAVVTLGLLVSGCADDGGADASASSASNVRHAEDDHGDADAHVDDEPVDDELVDDGHDHAPADAGPLGTELDIAMLPSPAESLTADGPFRIDDRFRSGVVFTGADGNAFVAATIRDQPVLTHLQPAFAAIGGGTLVPQPVAICFESVIGLVDGAGERYAVQIVLETSAQRWAVFVPDGGGPLNCGGGEIAVAGAGLNTIGMDWHEGRTFWVAPVELAGVPAVVGDVAFAPVPGALVGLSVEDGAALWRLDGGVVDRIVAAAPGAWVGRADGFSFVSPSGDELASFTRAQIDAAAANVLGRPVDWTRVGVAGTAGTPAIVIIDTDGVLRMDGTVERLPSETGGAVIAGVAGELVWVVREGATRTAVELVTVDGTVVQSMPLDRPFVPVVATDGFLVGVSDSEIVFVQRH